MEVVVNVQGSTLRRSEPDRYIYGVVRELAKVANRMGLRGMRVVDVQIRPQHLATPEIMPYVLVCESARNQN